MEPKMNFYYPEMPMPEAIDPAARTILPKPKTRKEYFLACFFKKLNTISPGVFPELVVPLNDNDKTDDLQYAWLVRKFVSPNPFELSANVYALSIKPAELAASYGVNIESLVNFAKKHSNIIFGTYYEVIIDNTYSCKVFSGSKGAVPCGPYTISREEQEGEEVLSIISETEPTHIPVVDVYAHYVINKQPKSTLEYYIAKAAGCPLLNADNPPEPKTTEEIYWASVCKEQEGGAAADDGPRPFTPVTPDPGSDEQI